MSLTPPQYKQMKQFLVSDNRINLKKGTMSLSVALEQIAKERGTNFKSLAELQKLLADKVGYTPSKNNLIPSKYPILKNFKYESTAVPFSKEEIQKFIKNNPKYKNAPESIIRRIMSERKAYANLSPEKKQIKKERVKKTRSGYSEEKIEADREAAALRQRIIRGTIPKFFKGRTANSLLWSDLIRAARAKDGYLKFKNFVPEAGKRYNQAQTEAITLVDRNGNEFKFKSLIDDINKFSGYKAEDVLLPYQQKEFLNKQGLTKQLNELANIKPGSSKAVFNVQHVQGIARNPFDVMLTFADQNIAEAGAKRTFDAKFKNAKNLTEKKTAVKNFYASLGPDIATKLGKKEVGIRQPFSTLLQKAGLEIKPGTPTYEKLMKFCPNNLAPGGMAGTCSIDEAITGMKNELAAVRNGSASLGAQSRTANKIKNLGQGGMRAIVKAGLLTDVGLEAAIGFDRFISEGDSPMQALRKSYLTAPLRFSGLMKSPEEGQRDELIKAALDKDKVEFVLDQQELINDRNEAVANLNRLKEQYDNDIFSESFIKKQQQDVLAAKRADLKDMYRSGELSRAEKFITGFQDPQSLKIKGGVFGDDRSYFDALKQAEEKAAAQRGERKFVPFGPIPMARLLKERIGETVTPDRIKKDMQERFGFTEDETTNLIDSLGGFDKFILDVKNEETARLGGAANMAEGGSIGKKSGPPPESGPNPQGLLSLIKRDIKI